MQSFGPSTIHISPSISNWGLIRRVINPEKRALLAHGDHLSIGRLLPIADLREWLADRNRSLAQVYKFGEQDFIGGLSHSLLENEQALMEAEAICVWIGVGLEDQLFLCWLPQFLSLIGADAKKLQIIEFSDTGEDRFPAWTVGHAGMTRLHNYPLPISISPQLLEKLDLVWKAVTSSTPDQLIDILSRELSSFTNLHRSMKSLIDRYPDATTGLSRIDHLLLEQTQRYGPTLSKVIGMTAVETGADYVSDFYLASRLEEMSKASSKNPLIELEYSGDPARLRGVVKLTEAGERVLSGKLNALTLNGIDDWIAGVHLDSQAKRVWVRLEGSIILSAMY